MIDLDNNEPQSKISNSDLLIDFHSPSKTPNHSCFAFINKRNAGVSTHSQSANNLIDLNSNENLKDSKFKEASDNIFKLYNESQENNSSKPNIFTAKNTPNVGNDLYNNNFSQKAGGQYLSNGYQQHPGTYNLNSNLFLNDLYSKSNESLKTPSTLSANPSSIKINQLDQKNMDPFRGLVNFK